MAELGLVVSTVQLMVMVWLVFVGMGWLRCMVKVAVLGFCWSLGSVTDGWCCVDGYDCLVAWVVVGGVGLVVDV